MEVVEEEEEDNGDELLEPSKTFFFLGPRDNLCDSDMEGIRAWQYSERGRGREEGR